MSEIQYVAWIAAKPLLHPDKFEDQDKFIAAWRVAPVDRSKKHETFVTPLLDLAPGPMQVALVTQASRIARRYSRCGILFVCDYQAFWGAFHPDIRWFEKWEADGFRKRPSAAREEWKELAKIKAEHDLLFRSHGPDSREDRTRIAELKRRIAFVQRVNDWPAKTAARFYDFPSLARDSK